MLYVTYTTKQYRKGGKMCAPYKYLITNNGTSYLAFVKTSAFKRWLRERGLKLKKAGVRFASIEGNFKTAYVQELPNDGLKTVVLHNGDYVPCVIKNGTEYVYHKGYATAEDYSAENMAVRLENYRAMKEIYG
jgi:hypothetical protein